VDMHCHVAVPRAGEIAAPHLKAATDPLVQLSTPETQQLMAKQHADIQEGIRPTGLRFKTMDDMGVDMQLVSPAPPQIYYTIPLDAAVQSARALNDGIAEYVAQNPDRLVALGNVPMQDGNEAAKELERCMKQLNFKGVEVLTNVAGRELSEPAFGPFWKKAEELDALVMIHPNGFTQPQRLSRFYFSNVIGNPLDSTVALHYLIFDGIFERHPNLRVLAVHGGGYLGSYMGRIDHAWGARSDAHGSLPKPPSHYLKKNVYFDTVVFSPIQLEMLVKTYGADRVVLGTDYPFDMADFDPIEHVVSTGFDAATTASICGGNAKTILGL
jgi:aminocarboxymuconate-semialdehyde decarboxylase